MISVIAALGQDRGIGYQGQLLWRIPEDLARFKRLTMAKTLVMGRKTYDSIGRPLPGRTTVVVTRNEEWVQRGVYVAHTVKDAIETASKMSEEVFVAGGAEIYREALPLAHKVYLTLIEAQKPADTFFPEWEREFMKRTFEQTGTREGIRYRFIEDQR